MKGTILGILCVLFAMALPVMASAEQDGTNSRCHDTDRGIDPYVFGFVRAGSLYMEDRCIVDDNRIAVVHENYCGDFDGWCYYAGVSRTVRYPSFEYAGYSIDVSEIGNDYAIFHILREGEDKEYIIKVGEVMKTTHGIIIRLDNVEPEREGVVYSVASEYIKTESYLCTGGCYAGACIGNLTPMGLAHTSCSALKTIDFVTPANDTVNTTIVVLPNIITTSENATAPVNSTYDDKKCTDKKCGNDGKKDKKDKKVAKDNKKAKVKKDNTQMKKTIILPTKKNTGNNTPKIAIAVNNAGKNIKIK